MVNGWAYRTTGRRMSSLRQTDSVQVSKKALVEITLHNYYRNALMDKLCY